MTVGMWVRQKVVETAAECYGLALNRPVWTALVDEDGVELVERQRSDWEGFSGAKAQWAQVTHTLPNKKGKRKGAPVDVYPAVAPGPDAELVWTDDQKIFTYWGAEVPARFSISA